MRKPAVPTGGRIPKFASQARRELVSFLFLGGSGRTQKQWQPAQPSPLWTKGKRFRKRSAIRRDRQTWKISTLGQGLARFCKKRGVRLPLFTASPLGLPFGVLYEKARAVAQRYAMARERRQQWKLLIPGFAWVRFRDPREP